MSLDDRACHVEVPRHHRAQRLRVEPLAERRRAGHVAEQDGHRLALLADVGGHRECGAAGIAEASPVPVLVAATRAPEHALSLEGGRRPKRIRTRHEHEQRGRREQQRPERDAEPEASGEARDCERQHRIEWEEHADGQDEAARASECAVEPGLETGYQPALTSASAPTSASFGTRPGTSRNAVNSPAASAALPRR